MASAFVCTLVSIPPLVRAQDASDSPSVQQGSDAPPVQDASESAPESESAAGPEAERELLAREAAAERTRRRGLRARLAIGQAFHGTGFALQVCVLADCDGTRPWGAASLIGAAAGATVGTLATRGGRVRSGTVALFNATPLLTTYLAAPLFRAFAKERDDDDDLGERRFQGALLGGHLAGYALAFGLDRWLEPTAGEVAAGTTLSAFATAYTSLLLFDGQVSRAEMGSIAAISLGSAFAGGALAHHVDMSSPRALAIAGGGVGGGGLGVLFTFLFGRENKSDAAYEWGFIGGSAAGLAATYVLTREMPRDRERDRPPITASVQPLPGGALAQVGGVLR